MRMNATYYVGNISATLPSVLSTAQQRGSQFLAKSPTTADSKHSKLSCSAASSPTWSSGIDHDGALVVILDRDGSADVGPV